MPIRTFADSSIFKELAGLGALVATPPRGGYVTSTRNTTPLVRSTQPPIYLLSAGLGLGLGLRGH